MMGKKLELKGQFDISDRKELCGVEVMRDN